MTWRQDKRDARKAGLTASRCDEPVAANPYSGTLADHWRRGWDEAQEEKPAPLPPGDYSATIETDADGNVWAVGTGAATGRRWFIFNPKDLK